MEGGNIDHSELVLMRPFYKTKDESRLVSFDTTFNNASISSITFENDLRYLDNQTYSGSTTTHYLKINSSGYVKLIGKILVSI